MTKLEELEADAEATYEAAEAASAAARDAAAARNDAWVAADDAWVAWRAEIKKQENTDE